jgi:hypothetical protein
MLPEKRRSSLSIAGRLGLGAVFGISLTACEPQEPTYSIDDVDATTSGGAGVTMTGGTSIGTGIGGAAGGAGSTVIDEQGGAAGAVSVITDSGSSGAPGADSGDAASLRYDTATAMFHGTPGGTATFTQHGRDVDVAVKLTSCAEGNHPIFIYGGLACDNAVDQGSRWDGARGNLADSSAASMISCKADQTGALNYTRLGSDDAIRWTVGDHDFNLDVTNRVLVVSAVGNEASRQSCADFR